MDMQLRMKVVFGLLVLVALLTAAVSAFIFGQTHHTSGVVLCNKTADPIVAKVTYNIGNGREHRLKGGECKSVAAFFGSSNSGFISITPRMGAGEKIPINARNEEVSPQLVNYLGNADKE